MSHRAQNQYFTYSGALTLLPSFPCLLTHALTQSNYIVLAFTDKPARKG